MRYVFSVLLLSFLSIVKAQSYAQKTMYTIDTTSFLNHKLVIPVSDHTPFGITLKKMDGIGIKKASISYNGQNKQDITASVPDASFTIKDISAITIELRLGKKIYDKADSAVYTELKYGNPEKRDTLPAAEAFNFAAQRGLTDFSSKRIVIHTPNNVLRMEDAGDFTIEFINAIATKEDSLRNSNMLVASLIKTLAGARPQDELLDLFVKLNYTRQKRFFSLIGADAGIGSNRNDSGGLFRINEAIANFNYAVYARGQHKIKKWPGRDPNKADTGKAEPEEYTTLAREQWKNRNDTLRKLNTDYLDSVLKRTFFFGTGLKIFNATPYVGVHLGSIEINGPLFGSYIMAGYYYSPYLKQVISKDSLVFQNYRHNVYLEAAINAFGSRVPSVLKTIRMKFGLMLPVRGGRGDGKDMHKPESKDIISRLSIEVPLGLPFRF